MINVCRGLWLLLLVSSGAMVGFAHDHTVVLDANESAPYWSQALPKDGMCGEIVHAASKAVGLVSHIHYKPLTRMIADDHNNDLGNPEFYMGNQDFAAVIPVCVYHVAVFYYQPNHTERLSFSSIHDLKGYKVGLLKGTLVDRSYYEQAGIVFEESYSQASLFKKLQRGRIDLVIEIDLVGQLLIDRLFPENKDLFVKQLIPATETPIAILIASDYPDAEKISAQYKSGLKKIKDNGQYLNILERYYGEGKVPDHFMRELEKFMMLYSYDEPE